MKKIFLTLVILMIFLAPMTSLAQGSGSIDKNLLKNQQAPISQNDNSKGNNSVGRCSLPSKVMLADLFNYATCIISTAVIPLLFALAMVMFIWGVIQYVINAQEEAKREKGRQFMIWGIIALAVMVSVWGLVGILRNTFGIQNVIPQVQTR